MIPAPEPSVGLMLLFGAMGLAGLAAMRGEENTDFVEWGFYQGFVSGVVDTLSGIGLVCTDGAKTGDVFTVVSRRFDDETKANSALPSKTCASEVVAAILMKRFPCESNEKSP
jgi:hypothetical protein